MTRAIFALACGIGLLVLGAPASAGPLQEGCSVDFGAYSEVVLTAEAAPGWAFVGWEGCSTAPPGYRQSAAAETCTVFMISAGHTYFTPS